MDALRQHHIVGPIRDRVTIAEVIKVAMTHGDDLFERDAYQWALQVYLMAAQGVYRLVNDSVPESSKTAEVALATLLCTARLPSMGPSQTLNNCALTYAIP